MTVTHAARDRAAIAMRGVGHTAIGAFLICLAAAAATACQASYSAAPSPTIVALDVHVRFPIGPVAAGSHLYYLAYAIDSDGVYRDVTREATWASDPNVAEYVHSTGTVRTFAPGIVEVSASYAGVTASLRLEVGPGCCSNFTAYPFISLMYATPEQVGSAAQARAWFREDAVTTRDVTELATWTSSNPSVATVDAGLVRAHFPGTVDITATYNGVSQWYRWSVPPGR